MKNFGKYILYLIIFLIIIVSASRWWIISVSDEYIFDADEMAEIKDCQTVIVLGAKVHHDGSMSMILKERAMATVDLYENGKACHIVISGYGNEVMPVKKYLIKAGVPDNIIVMDDTGKDTFTSIKNVRSMFEVYNIIVVTQAFHLPRAVYIGRMLGLETNGFVAYQYPYPSKLEKYKDELREFPASVKAMWQTKGFKNNE